MTRDNGSDIVVRTCNCLAMHIVPLKAAIVNRDKEIAELKGKLKATEGDLRRSGELIDDLYKKLGVDCE